MSENLSEVYKIRRIQSMEDGWPPNHPKVIVNVALIHHEGKQAQQELIDMSMYTISATDKSSHRITKRITDIFRSSQKCKRKECILIEGAPGLRKAVLAEKIGS